MLVGSKWNDDIIVLVNQRGFVLQANVDIEARLYKRLTDKSHHIAVL